MTYFEVLKLEYISKIAV